MTEQEVKTILQIDSFEHWDHVFAKYRILQERYRMELIQAKSDPDLTNLLNGRLDSLQQAFGVFVKLQNIPEDYSSAERTLHVTAESRSDDTGSMQIGAYAVGSLRRLSSWFVRLGERIKQFLLKCLMVIPAGVFSFSMLLLMIGMLWVLLKLLG